MRTTLRKIGNSQGVVIPKAILAQVSLGEEIDLSVRGNTIIISKPTVREGWEQACRSLIETATESHDEGWLNPTNHFDNAEWEW